MKLATLEAWEDPFWLEWMMTDDYGNTVGVLPQGSQIPPLIYVTQVYLIHPATSEWLVRLTMRAE